MSSFDLRPGQAHLWRFDLHRVPAEWSARLLSRDEGARATRFRFDVHRRRFVAGRAVVRTILGRYMAREPSRLEFRYGPQGKPALRSTSNVAFNLSHSDALALLVVASVDPLGVDVERIRFIPEMQAIARRMFSDPEASEVLAASNPLRTLKFFRCWTRKEAVVKALGGGLSIDLADFGVSLGPQPRVLSIHGDAREANEWTMTEVEPAPGYVAAVAIRSASIKLSCFDWPTCTGWAGESIACDEFAPERRALLAREIW